MEENGADNRGELGSEALEWRSKRRPRGRKNGRFEGKLN